MERRALIAGNWKMHLTINQAAELATAIGQSASQATDRDVMIAPPFTMLSVAARALEGTPVILAAQNSCWAEKGAFTGDISPVMLKEVGCSMVILGHSERRHIFGEDNAMVNKRLLGAMDLGLVPILCIGETLEEREAGRTMQVLENQTREGLKGVEKGKAAKLVVAYEPVWAIGTGKTASNEQAQEAHAFIRGIVADIFEKNIASQIRILYGGSVNPDNVDLLMAQEDIDGALVGGAALKADSFNRIIHFRQNKIR